MLQKQSKQDITLNEPPTTHQTFNDCPKCEAVWETIPAIPGVLHRTQLCIECANEQTQ